MMTLFVNHAHLHCRLTSARGEQRRCSIRKTNKQHMAHQCLVNGNTRLCATDSSPASHSLLSCWWSHLLFSGVSRAHMLPPPPGRSMQCLFAIDGAQLGEAIQLHVYPLHRMFSTNSHRSLRLSAVDLCTSRVRTLAHQIAAHTCPYPPWRNQLDTHSMCAPHSQFSAFRVLFTKFPPPIYRTRFIVGRSRAPSTYPALLKATIFTAIRFSNE